MFSTVAVKALQIRSKHYLASLVVLALALGAGAESAVQAQTNEGLPWLGSAMKSVLTLRVFDRYGDAVALGTAFLLEGGIAATNAHVLRGASEIEILDNDGASMGKVQSFLVADSVLDLALIAVSGRAQGGLRLADQDPSIGAYVLAIGSPLGLAQSVSDGITSGIRQSGSAPRLQITAPISPGSSGGPVLNRAGKVVGVAVQSLVAGQNLNFAVPVSSLKPFLNRERKPTSLDDFQFAPRFDEVLKLPASTSTGERIQRIGAGSEATFEISSGSLMLMIDAKPFQEIRLRVLSNEPLTNWSVISLVGKESQWLRVSSVATNEIRDSPMIVPASGTALLQFSLDALSKARTATLRVSLATLTEGESARSKTILFGRTGAEVTNSVSVTNLDYTGSKSFLAGERMVRTSVHFSVQRGAGVGSDQRDEVVFDCEARTFGLRSRDQFEFDGNKVVSADTAWLNSLLKKDTTMSPVETNPDMRVLGHFVCGMWGPK